MTPFFLTLLLTLTPLISAHFQLKYPVVRGYVEDTLAQFPCGGQNSVSSNRTSWPVAGGPVALNMGHATSAVQVLLALGNNPGSNFNITLMPVLQEQGLGAFCMKNVMVPSNLNVKDGMNATIQVITNGDPNGGLYNCADITFKMDAPATSVCTNGTGVNAVAYTGQFKNANGTDPTGTASSTASSTAAAASATKTGAASRLQWGVWGVVGGAMVGFAALL
ncbi:MAG: hypothetical protein M1812_005107 [Candelaria pacifica]|nr:MAG: hypothetical protein M1812_005107 [Candelaria pacifica]